VQHKKKERAFIETAFLQIEALQKAERDEPLKAKLRREPNPSVIPSFNLEEFLEINDIDTIIQACQCMPITKRELIGQYCWKLSTESQSKSITLVSIGSYRLQQELITAKTLMEKGFDVHFILIEPSYYIPVFAYSQVHYPRVKQAFDRVAGAMSQTYGKTCDIVAVYPSIHFYLKALMESLEFSLPEAFLVKEHRQFLSYKKRRFFYYDDKRAVFDVDAYKGFLANCNNAILFIKRQNIHYWCLRFDIEDEYTFFLEPIDPKWGYFLKCLDALYSYSNGPAEIRLNHSQLQNNFLLLQSAVLLAATQQIQRRFETLYHQQAKADVSAVDLIPDIFLAVDTNNDHIKRTLMSIMDFFRECLRSNGILCNPTFLSFERSDFYPNRMTPHDYELEQDESFTSQVPKKALSQFSYKLSEGKRIPFFPQKVVDCIAEYADTERFTQGV
jgi:hypothetical protein